MSKLNVKPPKLKLRQLKQPIHLKRQLADSLKSLKNAFFRALRSVSRSARRRATALGRLPAALISPLAGLKPDSPLDLADSSPLPFSPFGRKKLTQRFIRRNGDIKRYLLLP